MGSLRYLRLLFLALLLVSSNSTASQQKLLFRIHGSNTIGANLAPALIKAWMEKAAFENIQVLPIDTEEKIVVAVDTAGHDVAVQVQAYGSSTAFKDLLSEQTDIGMSSRSINEKELSQLLRSGNLQSKQSEVVIGLDGIAVIVHPDNPINHLDKATIKNIFSGNTRTWDIIGKPQTQINVYARDSQSGTYDTFKNLVLDKKTSLVTTAKRFASNAKLSDSVASDRWAIGFVGLPYVKNSKAIAVSDASTAIIPNPLSVATEDYAISRRLFLYLPPITQNPYAKSFVEFAASERGQKIVDEAGFISQNIGTYEQKPGIGAPQEYATMIKGAKRLSLNIRFNKGRANLDTKALRDVDRLQSFMALPVNRDAEILLFGFADSNEAIPLYSLGLSVQRVDSVADILLDNGIKVARVRGYGSEMPVADNESENGRYKNRRVEVWVNSKN